MAKIEDVQDAKLRGGLEKIDELINSGEYTQAARLCAETYLQLLEKRPDFMPPPPNPNLAPQHTSSLPQNRSRGGGGGGGMGRPGWPNQSGIRILYHEEPKPTVSYEKLRYGLSEACYFFEFLLEEVLRDQRE
jgi:hypothetical protein